MPSTNRTGTENIVASSVAALSGVRDALRLGSASITSAIITSVNGMRDAERSSYNPAPTSITYYAMRATDPDAPSLTYRTWVVYGTPDTNASRYTGTKSGNSALTNITVVAQWTVGK